VGAIDQPAEVLQHALDVLVGQMDKLAPIVKSALQHKVMKVRAPPHELAAGLIGQNHSGPEVLSVTRPTMTSISPNIAPGKMLGVPGKDNFDRNVHGWFNPALPMDDFLADNSRAGGTHHLAVSYGLGVETVEAFGKMMSWETVVIG
jgi:hypothetical protein